MIDDYDYEYGEEECPKCNHEHTHYRFCTSLYCEDGFVDQYETDPINYAPGQSLYECDECNGTGVESWCPNCGYDLSNDPEKLIKEGQTTE